MAQEMKIKAEPRKDQGKGAVKRLRMKGVLPAIVYGQGKQPELIELVEHDFEKFLRKHVSEHLVMDLQVGETKARKVLLKEVQHHPVNGRILHADFHEISMTDKLRVAIPIALVGDPEGVTQQGGVLEHVLRELEVECLPTDILESVKVDVSKLLIGHRVSAGDIKLDSQKYTIITSPELTIAAVAAPRAEEEVAPAEAVVAEAATAEPEVIGEKEREEARAAKEAEGGKEGKPGKEAGKEPAGKEPAGKESKGKEPAGKESKGKEPKGKEAKGGKEK